MRLGNVASGILFLTVTSSATHTPSKLQFLDPAIVSSGCSKLLFLTTKSPTMTLCTHKCEYRTQHCGHYKFQLRSPPKPPPSLPSTSISILPPSIMARPQLSAEVIAAIIFGLLQLLVGLVSIWQQRLHHRINSKRKLLHSFGSLADGRTA